jgi:site-specific recombinase XerD
MLVFMENTISTVSSAVFQRSRSLRKQVWDPAVRAAGIGRRVRVRDLRHAHASWVLAGGADLQIVRERLGHAGLRATENLHTLPDTDDAALAAFARTRTGVLRAAS